MHALRKMAGEIWWAAVQAVDPAAAVRATIRPEGDSVWFGDSKKILQVGSVVVVGAGKAAAAMAAGVQQALGGRVVGGLVIVPQHGERPDMSARLDPIVVHTASHPLLSEASLASTRALLSYLDAQASLPDSERPLVVFVISGGASALLELPRAGVTLTELQAANEAMLKAGRDIQALNTLRGGFSEVKGGRLWARYEGRLHFVTLVLSDVIGDDPAVVGSGPTCGWPPDWDAVERAVAGVPMPSTLSAIIRARPKSQFWQMPQRCHVRHVVASNAVALDAAAQAAEARGLKVMRWGEPLRGEARDVGRAIAQALLELDGSECLLAGGETTVTVRGDGRGGRAQELALAAACVLEGSDCVLLSAGSDGIDGRSESAGACVDGGSVARARAAGASPEAHLVRNDSASFHEASGDSWITGPTGTNVMDLVVALRPSRE